MSTLLLVRHGQASFGATNYDNLSDLGIAQSKKLGEYWAAMGRKFDAVFTGAQERQRQSLKAVQEACRKNGLSFPDPSGVMEEFNEYDSGGLMTIFFPKLVERNPRVQEIVKKSTGLGQNTPAGRKSFQELFEIIVDNWVRGEIEDPGVESWNSFRGRVEKGIVKVTSAYPSGKSVVIFTSGGPIAAALRYALSTPDEVAINLSWMIRNASITEFMYNARKFTLTGFNMTPQFRDDAMITYR